MCCGIWRRSSAKKSPREPARSEAAPEVVGPSTVPPQTSPLTPSAAATETPSASGMLVPDAIPLVQILPRLQDEQARDQPDRPKPYANSYDLWTEALSSLQESERQDVETFASDPDSANRKGLVVDIQERIDKAFKEDQHDSTARRIIESSVSVLAKFASVGDVAVSFDPVHAALPWAAVRSVVILLIANSELRGQLLAGIAEVASILAQCDTYQQLYMAPDLALRPPEAALGRLRTSIVQAYAKSQLFLGFTVQRQRSKIKIDAAFKLEDARGHVNTLAESQRHVHQAADDCEKHCSLSSRAHLDELRKLAADFPTVQQHVKSVLEIVSAEEQLKILEWVSPIPYGKHHITVKEARTSGTCKWLLGHEEFDEWRDIDSSAILWLQGSPGAGKTFLTSQVIDHVQTQLENSPNEEGFAYFYCNRNEEERRSPLSVLRSYVRQLSTSVRNPGHMRKPLRDLCREARLKGSDVGFDVCKSQLLESVNLYSQTTLILDALDECDPTSRWQLVEMMQHLISESEQPLKIFISSRPDDDIKRCFTSWPNVEIQATDNQRDIETFVNEEIDKPRRWGPISAPLRTEIVNMLLERSQGMFQWAYLQIKQVLELPTEEDIRSKLGKLPTGLKDAYDEIYGNIARHQHAKDLVDRACVWVMSAHEPLGSDVLLSAIRVDFDHNNITLANMATEGRLLALCNNLLVLDSQRSVWRFSHLSVVEYFETNHWNLRQAYCNAAKVCLKLLIETYKNPIEESEIESSDEEHDSEPQDMFDLAHPFQKYLRYHWIIHVRTYEDQLVKERQQADTVLAQLLQMFLGSPGNSSVPYRGWYRHIRYSVHQGYRLSPVLGGFNEISPEYVTICAMCRLSFYIVLRGWWETAEIPLSQKNDQGDDLLTLAGLAGCKAICQELLKRGMQINPSTTTGRYGSALAAAVACGEREVVELLIEHGADVNLLLSSGGNGSALATATAYGDREVV
ncbi:hypothetical protein QQX98_007214, partial [Neonectria punicea]